MHKCKDCREMCSAAGDEIQQCAGCGISIPAGCYLHDKLDELCISCYERDKKRKDEAYQKILGEREYYEYMMNVYREEMERYQ